MIKNLIRLIKAVIKRDEDKAYTMIRCCLDRDTCAGDHLTETGLTYKQHIIVSLKCFWYLLPVLLFLVVHAFYPNWKCNYATRKINKFEDFYIDLKNNYLN